MSTIFGHPGYLGWTSNGVIAIHADWPAYAVEHGLGYSLLSLGQFPPGTKFSLIDDVDRCFLFVEGEPVSESGPLPESRFYVALWHEDVKELAKSGFIFGAENVPYAEWAKRRAAELVGMYWQHPDGTIRQVPLPDPDDFSEDEATRVAVKSDGLRLSESGYQTLERMLFDGRDQITEAIMKRARPAILARLYDSAVREACVVVEATMRSAVGTEAFGAELIREFFRRAEGSKKFIAAQLKTFNTEVRAAFKFVRNEYAHNLRAISEIECLAILVRMSNVYERVFDIAKALMRVRTNQ